MTNQQKPRIRCSHHDHLTNEKQFLKVAGAIGCFTWLVIEKYCTDADYANRWPSTTKAIRAAVTL